ncbi:unnamed protein product [Amoebophrya sp. A25]|nr:unnamed protein product [Amoebophrya sp. A25]|eukprot:GSA25T00012080001.1
MKGSPALSAKLDASNTKSSVSAEDIAEFMRVLATAKNRGLAGADASSTTPHTMLIKKNNNQKQEYDFLMPPSGAAYSRTHIRQLRAQFSAAPEQPSRMTVLLDSLLGSPEYRERFRSLNAPTISQDYVALDASQVQGLPRCPGCCRDQQWRHRVVLARNPFVRFVSAFFYLLRQALLRAEFGLPKTSYWWDAGIRLLLTEKKECLAGAGKVTNTMNRTVRQARILRQSHQSSDEQEQQKATTSSSTTFAASGLADGDQVVPDEQIKIVDASTAVTAAWPVDLPCPEEWRNHMLQSMITLFQRWSKLVLSWRATYSFRGFHLNLGRFTTDEAHDILHLRPAVDVMTDPWLRIGYGLERSTAITHFPDEQTQSLTLPREQVSQGASGSTTSSESVRNGKPLISLEDRVQAKPHFVVHLEHKAEDIARLDSFLCENYGRHCTDKSGTSGISNQHKSDSGRGQNPDINKTMEKSSSSDNQEVEVPASASGGAATPNAANMATTSTVPVDKKLIVEETVTKTSGTSSRADTRTLPRDDVMVQKMLAWAANEKNRQNPRSPQVFALEFLSGCRFDPHTMHFRSKGCSRKGTQGSTSLPAVDDIGGNGNMNLKCVCAALQWKDLWIEDIRSLFLRHFERDFEVLHYKKDLFDLLPDEERSKFSTLIPT